MVQATPTHLFRQGADWFKSVGPRVVAAAVGGYYGLGIAYATGLMARIDQIAIPIIVGQVGYLGLGGVMPQFQWYSAWAIRFGFGALAACLYDVIERIVLASCRLFAHKNQEEQEAPAPLTKAAAPSPHHG